MYASGWDPQELINQAGNPALSGKLVPALIWNQNPDFEIALNHLTANPRRLSRVLPTFSDFWSE